MPAALVVCLVFGPSAAHARQSASYEQMLLELRENYAELSTHFEELRRRFDEQRIDRQSYESAISGLQEELLILSASLESSIASLRRSQSTVTALREELTSSQILLDEQASEIAGLQRSIETLQARLREALRSLTASSATIDRLDRQVTILGITAGAGWVAAAVATIAWLIAR